MYLASTNINRWNASRELVLTQCRAGSTHETGPKRRGTFKLLLLVGRLLTTVSNIPLPESRHRTLSNHGTFVLPLCTYLEKEKLIDSVNCKPVFKVEVLVSPYHLVIERKWMNWGPGVRLWVLSPDSIICSVFSCNLAKSVNFPFPCL